MHKKRLFVTHLARMFAVLSINIIVASVFTLLLAAPLLLHLPSGTAHAQDFTTPMLVAGAWHTVGLKSDGTVVAVGDNRYGQCDVGSWTGIIQVAAMSDTVGLKSDGTVVAVGYNDYGELNVSSWTGITQVAAGTNFTLGLNSDGTVVAVGDNSNGAVMWIAGTLVLRQIILPISQVTPHQPTEPLVSALLQPCNPQPSPTQMLEILMLLHNGR